MGISKTLFKVFFIGNFGFKINKSENINNKLDLYSAFSIWVNY